MAALGHTSTPFCFVIRHLLGFFPGQVHLSEVPFDDIYPVLPRSSWLSLVTSQFPVCCLTSCSRVVHSQDVSKPPEPSFFNYIFQFPWCLHFWPCPYMWSPTVFSGTYGELLLIFLFLWQIVAMILHHTTGLRWQVTHKAWFSRRGWYSCFSRCLLVSQIHLPLDAVQGLLKLLLT